MTLCLVLPPQGGAEHKIPVVISKISKEQKGRFDPLPVSVSTGMTSLPSADFSPSSPAELSGLLFIGDGILQVRRRKRRRRVRLPPPRFTNDASLAKRPTSRLAPCAALLNQSIRLPPGTSGGPPEASVGVTRVYSVCVSATAAAALGSLISAQIERQRHGAGSLVFRLTLLCFFADKWNKCKKLSP